MKTSVRMTLLLFAGLIVAGCANKTAQLKPAPATNVASLGETPMPPRYYWMLRDLEIRSDRDRSQP
jgi:hypothetical protein